MNGGGDGAIRRLFDVNANRAREALRVLEDYARFVLDHDGLSAELKDLRHRLTAVTRPFLPESILHRDTVGDVGTTITTVAEQRRTDLDDVVTAAGKRLGEAVRSLEEYAKTFDTAAAAQLEAIRYRFYTVEQQLARTLRPIGRFAATRLYVLITESACRHPWEHTAGQAILGGADALQLREKTLEAGELLSRARRFVALCRRHNVISIVNDRPDVALLSGADGVHVGQGDLPAADVRKLLGPDRIVGVSTHELPHAERAVADGADYVGVGPVFRSSTKPRDILPGLPYAAAVAARIKIPAVAIAGITAGNVDQVLATGVRAVAVMAAVTGADDVRAAAAALKAKLTVHLDPAR
jgi:thiamine-phosphate pyrophosphorylase